ncbi:MAG: glycine--tRNA ligase subunit alpha [Candidatus Hodgkinia cicadicola]
MWNVINKLTSFWVYYDCKIIKTSKRRLGAATFHFQLVSQILRADKCNICYAQPTYRPFDCDFGLSNKLQRYHQYQVILNSSDLAIPTIFKKSLKWLGLENDHRLVFNKSTWYSASLCAFGEGWECILNTIEIAQITCFNQVCSTKCSNPTWEVTYGLERLMFALLSKTTKLLPTESARCTYYMKTDSLMLIRKLKSSELRANAQTLTDTTRLYYELLSSINIYNQLIVKRTIKRYVNRIILTRIQFRIKTIANLSKQC